MCRKPTKILEINRTLRPEHQMLFRNPKDLLEMYVKNINSVLDFQAHHRSRLFKARQEQVMCYLMIFGSQEFIIGNYFSILDGGFF